MESTPPKLPSSPAHDIHPGHSTSFLKSLQFRMQERQRAHEEVVDRSTRESRAADVHYERVPLRAGHRQGDYVVCAGSASKKVSAAAQKAHDKEVHVLDARARDVIMRMATRTEVDITAGHYMMHGSSTRQAQRDTAAETQSHVDKDRCESGKRANSRNRERTHSRRGQRCGSSSSTSSSSSSSCSCSSHSHCHRRKSSCCAYTHNDKASPSRCCSRRERSQRRHKKEKKKKSQSAAVPSATAQVAVPAALPFRFFANQPGFESLFPPQRPRYVRRLDEEDGSDVEGVARAPNIYIHCCPHNSGAAAAAPTESVAPPPSDAPAPPPPSGVPVPPPPSGVSVPPPPPSGVPVPPPPASVSVPPPPPSGVPVPPPPASVPVPPPPPSGVPVPPPPSGVSVPPPPPSVPVPLPPSGVPVPPPPASVPVPPPPPSGVPVPPPPSGVSVPPPPPGVPAPLPPSGVPVPLPPSDVPVPPPPPSGIPVPPPGVPVPLPPSGVPVPPPPAAVPVPPPPTDKSAADARNNNNSNNNNSNNNQDKDGSHTAGPTLGRQLALEREKILLDRANRYVASLEEEVQHRALHLDVTMQQLAEEEARNASLRRDRDALLELSRQLERRNDRAGRLTGTGESSPQNTPAYEHFPPEVQAAYRESAGQQASATVAAAATAGPPPPPLPPLPPPLPPAVSTPAPAAPATAVNTSVPLTSLPPPPPPAANTSFDTLRTTTQLPAPAPPTPPPPPPALPSQVSLWNLATAPAPPSHQAATTAPAAPSQPPQPLPAPSTAPVAAAPSASERAVMRHLYLAHEDEVRRRQAAETMQKRLHDALLLERQGQQSSQAPQVTASTSAAERRLDDVVNYVDRLWAEAQQTAVGSTHRQSAAPLRPPAADSYRRDPPQPSQPPVLHQQPTTRREWELEQLRRDVGQEGQRMQQEAARWNDFLARYHEQERRIVTETHSGPWQAPPAAAYPSALTGGF